MNSTSIGLLAVGCMFTGALAGLWLQKRLPAHHLDKNSQEIVKIGSGMIATLAALVLGLLVNSAKSTFDTINTRIQHGSAKTVLLDRILAQYGPEAQTVRDQIKQSVAASLGTTQRKMTAGAPEPAASQSANRVESVQSRLRELVAKTDSQRQLLTEAQQIAGDLAQGRWMMLEEAQSELPMPLLFILICWLTVLFISLGLISPRNATVVSVLFVCACTMSAALFLVMELNRPMEGFIKASTAPMRNIMQNLGR
jgi:hypothetical protein